MQPVPKKKCVCLPSVSLLCYLKNTLKNMTKKGRASFAEARALCYVISFAILKNSSYSKQHGKLKVIASTLWERLHVGPWKGIALEERSLFGACNFLEATMAGTTGAVLHKQMDLVRLLLGDPEGRQRCEDVRTNNEDYGNKRRKRPKEDENLFASLLVLNEGECGSRIEQFHCKRAVQRTSVQSLSHIDNLSHSVLCEVSFGFALTTIEQSSSLFQIPLVVEHSIDTWKALSRWKSIR